MIDKRFLLIILGIVLLLQGDFRTANAASQPGSHETAGQATAGPSGGDSQGESYTVTLQGNTFFTDEELLKRAAEEIRTFEQKGFRKSDIDDAAYIMRVAYLQAGFAFAMVDYSYEKQDGEDVRVRFTITEGSRVKISTITFTGNDHVQAETLLNLYELTAEIRQGGQEKPYVESDLKETGNRIRDYYRAEGFADISVDRPELRFSDDRDEVSITIHLNEGPRHLIDEVVFSGDLIPLLAADLKGIKEELLGKPYYTRRKLLLRSRIKEAYDNMGYADSDIEIQAVYPNGPGKVILRAAIESGRQIRIAGVVISGNDRTRDSFIRNRLQLRTGDIYSNTGRRESFRKLFDTGLFAEIEIELSEPLEDGGRNLEVRVVELPARELYVEPGWGSYERLRLGAGALEKNLFGTGRNGRIEALVSTKSETLTLSFTDPWLLQTDISMSVPLSYERREEPSYTSKETELSFLFSKKLSEALALSAGYSFSRTETSDLNGQGIVLAGDENYNKGTVSVQAVWDTRDNLFYPAGGLRLAAGLDLSLPATGSELDFGRLTFGCRYFLELPNTFVLGLRAATGLVVPLLNQNFLPPGERFFNGGDNTVRSYKHSELGPKDNQGEPVGGLGYNVFSIELRRRFHRRFVASLYVDAGNIAPNESLLARNFAPYNDRTELLDDTLGDFWGDFKFGAGFGLMYLLPVGPARIDIAYNPDPEKKWQEDSWVFHFSLGMAF